MATTKKLTIEIEMDSTGAIKGIKGLGKASNKFAKDTKKNSDKMKKSWASTVIGINQGLELAKKGFNALKKVFDLSNEFLKYKQGMDALARNTGQNSDKIVAKLREVSDGTVANKDLMLAANRAVALNVTKDVDKMSQLMEISRLKAKAMGIDTTQAFNDMVTGIGRGSPLILDNLGIITKGWAEEAKAAGVAMDAQFILNKVLKDGAVEIANAGEMGLTGAERVAKMGASFDNLKIAIGEFIQSPAVQDIVTFITDITNGISEMINMQKELSEVRKKELDIIGKGNDLTKKQRDSIIDLGAAEADLVKVRGLLERQQKNLANKKKDNEEITQAELDSLKVSIGLYNDNLEAVNKARQGIGSLSVTTEEAINIFKKWSVEMDVLNTKSTETADIQKENISSVTKFTEEQLTARKEAWNTYYTFIGDQRTLDLTKEIEDFATSKEALDLLLEQKQISLAEHSIMLEENQAIHDMNMLAIQEEFESQRVLRNQIANDMVGKNFEDLTLRQKVAVDKQLAQQQQATAEIQKAWNTAIGNAVNDFSQGVVDMAFDMETFKKGFGEVVKTVVLGFIKMILKALVMKAVMSTIGGIGLFFKQGGMIPEFADGGKLSGPAHSQGGININAEGGEYMVRKKSVTPETLPILMAINSGISNLASMSMGPLPKFADGGPVTNNSNSTQNKTANINSVNILSPNPQKLFDQFVEFADDMGVDLTRR